MFAIREYCSIKICELWLYYASFDNSWIVWLMIQFLRIRFQMWSWSHRINYNFAACHLHDLILMRSTLVYSFQHIDRNKELAFYWRNFSAVKRCKTTRHLNRTSEHSIISMYLNRNCKQLYVQEEVWQKGANRNYPLPSGIKILMWSENVSLYRREI